MTGSEHNDEFYMDEHGRIRTRTNRSGGIQVIFLWMVSVSSSKQFSVTLWVFFSGWDIKWGNHNHENSFQADIYNCREQSSARS